MQRTKKGRGVKAFQLRSGPESPYPFLKGVGNFFKKAAGVSPIGMLAKALKGKNDPNTAAGEAVSGVGGDAQATLDAVKELVSDDDTMGGGDLNA
tara:strand:- start:639 stop:923 length:285 start_codon:yes stop_codon:yes gene_type:complete